MKETLHEMKRILIEHTYSEIQNLPQANYKELGAAIDMIKDLEEALYYCTVVEAMEKPEEEKHIETSQKTTHSNVIQQTTPPIIANAAVK